METYTFLGTIIPGRPPDETKGYIPAPVQVYGDFKADNEARAQAREILERKYPNDTIGLVQLVSIR